jgi:hypothetical protein
MSKRNLIIEYFPFITFNGIYNNVLNKKFYIWKINRNIVYFYNEDVNPPENEGCYNPWFTSSPPVSHRYNFMTFENIEKCVKSGLIKIIE